MKQIKYKWEVESACTGTAKLSRLLARGDWEPFAVVFSRVYLRRRSVR